MDEVLETGQRWAGAEQRADADALGGLVTDDFTLVGPVGFVLDRRQYLDRFQGGFAPEEVRWEDVSVRRYGDAAVTVATLSQRATYAGQRADGRFRVTHVFVRRHDRWWVAGEHLSPIGGPPPFARPDS